MKQNSFLTFHENMQRQLKMQTLIMQLMNSGHITPQQAQERLLELQAFSAL